MLHREPLLVTLVKLVDQIPMSKQQDKRRRGRPRVYSDGLILKALVITVIRRLYTAYSLLAFLGQDTELADELRQLLTTKEGRFPSHRTWERRLKALPDTLPGLIGSLGRHLVALIRPPRQDSTPLRARGGVWHKKHREQGSVLHSSIDTEAHWSQSGYHGWWHGWKLHLACTTGPIWIPLAAELTAASVYDGSVAPDLLLQLPVGIRYVLGDRHYNTPEVHPQCRLSNRWLIVSRLGPYPHRDPGVEVGRILHKLRSKAIEPLQWPVQECI